MALVSEAEYTVVLWRSPRQALEFPSFGIADLAGQCNKVLCEPRMGRDSCR